MSNHRVSGDDTGKQTEEDTPASMLKRQTQIAILNELKMRMSGQDALRLLSKCLAKDFSRWKRSDLKAFAPNQSLTQDTSDLRQMKQFLREVLPEKFKNKKKRNKERGALDVRGINHKIDGKGDPDFISHRLQETVSAEPRDMMSFSNMKSFVATDVKKEMHLEVSTLTTEEINKLKRSEELANKGLSDLEIQKELDLVSAVEPIENVIKEGSSDEEDNGAHGNKLLATKYFDDETASTSRTKKAKSGASFKLETNRVIYAVYEPFQVITKNSLGRLLFGRRIAKTIYYTIATRSLFALWAVLAIVTQVITMLSMEEVIPTAYGFSVIFILFRSILGLSVLNVKIVRKLAREFLFWLGILSAIAGSILWAILLENTLKRVIVLVMGLYTFPFCFVDAIPPTFRARGRPILDFLCISAWYFYGLFSISKLSGTSLDQSFAVPLVSSSEVSISNMASSALMQYLIVLVKIIVGIFLSSEKMILMRAPIKSQIMHAKRAKQMMKSAAADKLLQQIGKLGQTIISNIVGGNKDEERWDVIEETERHQLSRRLIRSLSSRGNKIYAFKCVFQAKVSLKNAFEDLFDNEEDDQGTWRIVRSTERKTFGRMKQRKTGTFHSVNRSGEGVVPSIRNVDRQKTLHTIKKDTTKMLVGAKRALTGTKRTKSSYSNLRSIKRIQYRLVPLPLMMKDRLIALDFVGKMFQEHGFAFTTGTTTERALRNTPPELIKNHVIAHVHCGGYFLERIGDEDSEWIQVSYIFALSLGGFIPQNVSDL
eukprot:g1864.t1